MIQGIDCTIWRCQIHVPADPSRGQRFGSNKTISIVAPKMEDAIAMLRGLFPSCSISSVITNGKQEVYWDSTMIPIITDPRTKGGS